MVLEKDVNETNQPQENWYFVLINKKGAVVTPGGGFGDKSTPIFGCVSSSTSQREVNN